MGIQIPLPAMWARSLKTLRHHPADRLDAYVQDKPDAKAAIRAILDRLAEKYGVPASDVTDAMGCVDEGLGDLFYDIEIGFQHAIESEDPI